MQVEKLAQKKEPEVTQTIYTAPGSGAPRSAGPGSAAASPVPSPLRPQPIEIQAKKFLALALADTTFGGNSRSSLIEFFKTVSNPVASF